MSAAQSLCSTSLNTTEHQRGPNSGGKESVDINVSKLLHGNEARMRIQLYAWQIRSSSDLTVTAVEYGSSVT